MYGVINYTISFEQIFFKYTFVIIGTKHVHTGKYVYKF